MPNTMKGVKRISGRSGDSAQFETEARRKRRMERDFPSGDKEPTTKAAGGWTSMKKQMQMACGGKTKRMAAGGANKMKKVARNAVKKHEETMHRKGGSTKMVKMAAGGSYKAKCDGAAQRGKTRGRVT